MIFKNAHIYRFTNNLNISQEELNHFLEAKAFKPCSGIRPSTFGWVPPISGRELAHEVSGCFLLCAKKEDKVVPSSALKDLLDEKIEKMEAIESRPIRAKESQSLKEDALAQLLPRALPKSKLIFGYFSSNDELLVVDTAFSAEAEIFLNCLRETLGSLKVVPPQVKSKPTDTYTHWLRSGRLPENFLLGDQCDLIDPEDSSAASFRRQDLGTSEVKSNLDAGKICSKISIVWRTDLKASIDKDLILRQIKFISSDDTLEENIDPIAEVDAAFVNMTLEFSRFLPELFSALGGETRS